MLRAIEHSRLAGLLHDLSAARLRRAVGDALKEMSVFPISEEVTELASAPFGSVVAAVDALHVATAQLIQRHADEVIFWTHDAERAAAAMTRGLMVAGLPLD